MKKTQHAGTRKRKARAPLPEPSSEPRKMRSMLSCGRTANTLRAGVQYSRRANRRARTAGFGDARQHMDYLARLYEYGKRLFANRG